MTVFRRALAFVSLFVSVLVFTVPAFAQDKPQADKTGNEKLPSIAEKTKGLQSIDGYLPLYWQSQTGKLFMEIGRFHQEMLYQVSLPAGLGSNPVGLDRGQLGDSSVITFERIGQKVLMVQPNYHYRAITTNEAERQAVDDSFARSVLWGFKVEAEEGDRALVDATAFFMRDAHGVVDRLRQTKQGKYKLDDSRSAPYMPRTKGFPKNTEVETILTFTTEDDPGCLHPSDDPVTGGGHAARASFVRRVAGFEIPATQARSRAPLRSASSSTTTHRRSTSRSRSAGFRAIDSRRRIPQRPCPNR